MARLRHQGQWNGPSACRGGGWCAVCTARKATLTTLAERL